MLDALDQFCSMSLDVPLWAIITAAVGLYLGVGVPVVALFVHVWDMSLNDDDGLFLLFAIAVWPILLFITLTTIITSPLLPALRWLVRAVACLAGRKR